MRRAIDTVLFDLDGTLADTAPDLANALNVLRAEHGQAPLPYAALRPLVSRGAYALLRFGMEVADDDPERDNLRSRLLVHYENCLAAETTLMAGMPELLDSLDGLAIRWGVVTNKPAWLTEPLLDALDVSPRACCVISGDTTRHAKPHPEPMLEAMRRSATTPARTLYVGDAQSDVQAARAAGVASLIARYGYIGADEDPDRWGADALIDTPREVLSFIGTDNAGGND